MREWIDLELEVLTPAFISGANPMEVELRAASIRGLLRWWWRAAVGHRYQTAEDLRRQEAGTFGGAAEKLKSCVAVEIPAKTLITMDRGQKLPDSGYSYSYARGSRQGTADILPYLAYGPVRLLTKKKLPDGRPKDPVFKGRDGKAVSGPVLVRPALEPGSKFRVRLSWFSSALSEDQRRDLARAACAWITLGGLGARSRKGFGQLDGQIASASTEELRKQANEWWESARQEWLQNGKGVQSVLPPFPQLEYRQVISTKDPRKDWPEALGAAGQYYKDELLPALEKNGVSWLRGSANPRRASSILLAVLREKEGYKGLICVLLCDRNSRPTIPAEATRVAAFLQQLPRFVSNTRQRTHDSP